MKPVMAVVLWKTTMLQNGNTSNCCSSQSTQNYREEKDVGYLVRLSVMYVDIPATLSVGLSSAAVIQVGVINVKAADG